MHLCEFSRNSEEVIQLPTSVFNASEVRVKMLPTWIMIINYIFLDGTELLLIGWTLNVVDSIIFSRRESLVNMDKFTFNGLHQR